MSTLEKYFQQFRQKIVGIDAHFETPYGIKPLIYADWIASGRLYKPIEQIMSQNIGQWVGNTHSESSYTGVSMTQSYKLAQQIIKQHVNADANDVFIATGSGMTHAINKFQRILGVKVPEQMRKITKVGYNNKRWINEIAEEDRPVVFITHMEHHSNHTSWLETIADVVLLEPDDKLAVNPEELRRQLREYSSRKLKIGSFSGCSNVTGITPPVGQLARIMHEYGGYCFVDYAASAPYADMNMHPEDPMERLDAIFFSPHKFLGGPGSSGILIFNSELYNNETPDHPGGGTVSWTNRWGEFSYINDIEVREDGGTPAFLQTIRAALAVKLKEKMGVHNIHEREKELLEIAFARMPNIPNLYILQEDVKERLGVISFYVLGTHHNLIVRLLNDRYGIQVRGGCSCAGTYGHFLLHVDRLTSLRITQKIDQGDLTEKPGWVRLSLHPTMTNDELHYCIDAIEAVVKNGNQWSQDYIYHKQTGEFSHKIAPDKQPADFSSWFEV